MFLQLGNIIFENLKTPNDYSKSGEALFAEHSLIDGKPRLQRTGSTLEEISMSIRFHVSFCNPKTELSNLITARDEGQILPLLWGNGEVEGDFVITELSRNIEDADPQGNVFCYVVDLSLKEYVGKSKFEQEQQQNIKSAKAVGDKKPVVKRKTNPLTCPQLISSIISKIEAHGSVVNKIVLERGGVEKPENKATAISNLKAISKLSLDIKNRTDQSESCVYQNADIRNKAVEVQSTADVFEFDVNSNTNIASDNENLQRRIGRLRASAQILTNQAITRK